MAALSRTTRGAPNGPAVQPERPLLEALGKHVSGLTTPAQAAKRPAKIDASGRERDKANRQRPGRRSEMMEELLGQQRQAMAQFVKIQRQIAATLKPTRRGCKGGRSRRRRALQRDPASGGGNRDLITPGYAPAVSKVCTFESRFSTIA